MKNSGRVEASPGIISIEKAKCRSARNRNVVAFIATLILTALVFSPSAFATTAAYYPSTAGSSVLAYDVDTFPFAGDTNTRNAVDTPSAAERTNMSASNNTRWTTVDPGNGDEVFLWIAMTINLVTSPVAKIYQIDFTFEGHLNNSNANFSTYVMGTGLDWWQTASWPQIGADETIFSNTDSQYTRTISLPTDTISDYIDAGSGLITWGIYEDVSNESMDVDYLNMLVYYDITAPTTTINSPAAGSWQGPNFTVDVTNADTESGLNVCYYRVFSSAVQTLAWTAYGCATNPTITVGAGMNCRNQGVNLCQVELYSTDMVANAGLTVTRQFSIDYTAPAFVVTDGANGAWNVSDTITVTVSDAGGSLVGATTNWGYSADATCDAADDANLTNSGLTTTVNTTHTDYICFTNTDGAGNKGYSAAIGPLKVDVAGPTATITAPADGAWETAAFTVSVTNADVGSGLNLCYYRVLSNTVQTKIWASYGCATNPSITVGAGLNCRDQGTNMCQVEFYNTDIAGNTGTISSRQFSIDWTIPTTTLVGPAAGSWQTADFVVDVTNADTGGSGLNQCFYRILSNAVETLGWTSYACGTDQTLTVGAAANCLDQGANMCEVQFYNTDTAGNTGTTQTRLYSIDWTLPTVTINNPAASSCQNGNFSFDVTNADTGSGLNVCYYRALSNAVQTLGWTSYACGTDPSITVWGGQNCRDQGADMCQIEAYDTDTAGNTGTTQSRLFSIDWTAPTQSGWSPANGDDVNSAPTVSLTLNEQGDCRWSLDGDESYDNMADDGDCTGDGTVNASCAVSGLPEGSVTVWIACQDSCANKNSAANNAALTYSVDTQPPAQLTWNPAKSDVVCDTNQSIVATTDENAYCRWSLSDIDYNSMSNDCSGSGTASQTCSASGLSHGADFVYISCKDSQNNKDTAATNEDIDYTVDIIAPSGYANSSPANGATDVSLTPTLTSAVATDVSTISYYFQIDDNAGFTNAGGRLQQSGWLSADNDWVPAALDSNRLYYWRVKAKDVCDFEGTYSSTFSFTTLQNTPNITFVSFSQATDGSGKLTVTYNLSDPQSDAARFLIDYSFDNITWYQAYIDSASAGTVSNTGVSGGTSTGQLTAIPTPQANATFIWDTKNAGNQGGAYASEDDSVYIRVTTYDAAQGETQTSTAFEVDDKAPANYSCSTPTNGTNGVSITPTLTAAAGTDQNTIQYLIEIAKDEAFSIAAQQSGWQAGLTWNPAALDQGIMYYWRVKAIDSFGNEGAFDTPTFSFTTSANEPDVNIDSVSQTSTAGEGYVRTQYDLTDPNAGDTCGIYIEYSYDNTNWYKAWILDASVGTVNNGAARQVSALSCGAGVSNAWFRWATQNAGNGNGAFAGEDSSVYLRITPNDGTYTGQIRNSAFSSVDNQAPTAYNLQYPANGESGVDTGVTLMAATATDISTVYYMFRIDKAAADWAPPDFQESAWQGGNSWTVGTSLAVVTNYEYAVKAKDQYGNSGSYVTSWQFTTEAAPTAAAWPFDLDTDYTYDTNKISVTSDMALLRANVDPAWFDTRWTYRKKITVDNTASSNALYDYQILVTLNAGNFDFSKARADGGDLRFYGNTGQGTPLKYWLQNYNSVGQTARIWVKVTEIPAGAEYSVYMYYGYASATTTDSITDTLDAAQWTDGNPTWTKIDTKTNVTEDTEVVLGEELILNGETQNLGGTVRKSRIELLNNSTINVIAGQILRLYANEIRIEAGSQINGYKKGYDGGAGSVLCIDTGVSTTAPWYGGQQIGNNGLYDTTGCPAATCYGGGGVSYADGTDGRDGRGGGGGGYGGAGGRGENGWQGYDPDDPGCTGNYYLNTTTCANTYGTTFGSQTDTSLYMGSGGGAGSASCYWNSNPNPMVFSTLAIGGSGGVGGGAVLLDAGTITIENDATVDEIRMDGGLAESGGSDPTHDAGGGAGGGGSGGTIVVRGQNVNITGNLTARGGMGGGFTNYGASGGGGGGGRTKIFAENLISGGTQTVTGGAVGGNNPYTPNAVAGAAGSTYTNNPVYSYDSGIVDTGNFTSDVITPFFLGKTFTSSHTLPGVASLSYEIRRASDNAVLCTINTFPTDILSCTLEDTPVYIYALLDTTDFPGSPVIADITLDYYTRQIVGTPPSVSVGAEQTHSYYSDNPTIRPITSRGIVFAELVSFTETVILPDTTGQVRYQISNDGTSWYWWNGANWAIATTFGQTNTAADINSHCGTFDNEIGGGTLYFNAYLNSDGSQKILLDAVDVEYVSPPTPDITLLSPNNGVTDTQVVITGTDFGTSQGASTVTFNGIAAGSAISWSNTSITINAPLNVSTGYVIVTVRNVQSPQEADSVFTVNPPAISSLTPGTAYWSDTIVIGGSNFGSAQGGSYVTFFSGKIASCSAWTNTSITCAVPSGAQTGNITVTTGGGVSAGSMFTLSSDNSTWPFDTAGDYTPTADANVSGGLAYVKSSNSPSWAQQNYSYRRAITIDNTGGALLNNFQVRIQLNNTNFSFGSVQADGKDIRFIDSDGTTAINNFWIESYSATTLTGTIWVKVPVIPAGTTKTIYMYYGYPGETTVLTSKSNTLIFPTTWTDGNPTYTKVGSSTNINPTALTAGDARLAYQTNTQPRTCDDTWGSSCGADSDAANTCTTCGAACSNHGGTVTYEKVVQVTVNATKAGIGDTINATCTFKSANGSEWYMYYYNGTGWALVPGMSGAYADNAYHTQSGNITVSGNMGTQYVRCIIDRDGEADSCASGGTYYDNDDANFYVHYKTSGELTSDEITGFMGGSQLSAAYTDPDGAGLAQQLSYKILRASDNTTLCTCATVPCDISVCASSNENVKVWGSLTTTSVTATPNIADWTATYYSRLSATPEPTSSISLSEESRQYYATDPTVQPAPTKGKDFVEVLSFSDILGPDNAGTVKYQISNNGTNWYYWNGANWAAAGGGYATSNTATEINSNVQTFDDAVGPGTFFFRAYLHSNGAQAVELDGVTINVAQITITEVHNDGTQASEGDDFIQIYNPFSADYSLTGHIIGDDKTTPGGGENEYAIPAGEVIPARGYYLIAKSSAAFISRFACDAASVHEWGATLDLNSAGDEIYIKKASDPTNSLDLVLWGAYQGADLPEGSFNGASAAPISGNGNSIKRITDGYEDGERDGGDAGTSPENDENLGATFIVVSPPTPFCTPPTTGTITISDNSGYTNDSTPPITLTCEDPAGTNCDSSDFMRIACTEAGLASAAWTTFETKCNETGYTCAFNVTSGTGCSSGEGTKTVWVEYKNHRGNIQTTHTSDSTVYDITAPTISAVKTYSDREQYICGTADSCVSLSATAGGTTYFNNLGGEGSGQKMTVEVEWSDNNGAGALDQFVGPYAFAESPTYNGTNVGPDTSSVDGWKQIYTISSGESDEAGIIYRVYDKAGNSSSVTLNFAHDNADPTITYNSPSAGGVTNWYKTDPGTVVNIDFGWGGSGCPLSYAQYKIGAGSWTDIFNAFQYSNYTSNWNIAWATISEGMNQISVQVMDGCGNMLSHSYVETTTGFIFRKDTTPPTVTGLTITSNTENYFDGTTDGVDCSSLNVYPAVTCTIWFNSLAGEGGGQIMTGTLTWTDAASYDRLQGPSMFGQTPDPDTTSTPWSLVYNIPNGSTDQTGEDFSVYDLAGNGKSVKIDYKVDNTDPTTTINSPAASSWHWADFVVDVTNADVGSGLVNCYYRVLSNAVQTVAWTSYTCGNDPTLTIGAAANCRDQGADICQVEFYTTDRAGNVGTTVTRQFGIDWEDPTIAFVSPAASSWQGPDFVVDVTEADTGSGLSACEWRVVSNSIQTLAWTTYVCGNDPTATVGAAKYCNNEGVDKCEVFFRATDAAGRTCADYSRKFSIDWTLPTTTIVSPAASAWKNADFVVDVTNADSGSGLNVCSYRVLSNAVETLAWTSYVCGNDPTLTVGAAANCRDEGSDKCQVEFYNTDVAGNTGTTVTRTFSIDWTPPTDTIVSPAASAWKGADFVVDVTNADPGTGSGLNTCNYRVLSNAVQTLGWTSYTCGNDPTLTVGAAANCRNQGLDKCRIELYNTDVAGNTGVTVQRDFSIDWDAPTLTSITIGSNNETYFYGNAVDGLDCTLAVYPTVTCVAWFNSVAGEGGGQNVTASVVWSDTGAQDQLVGAAAFADTPAPDTIAPWTVTYSVDNGSADQNGVDFTVYDKAGNSAAIKIDFLVDNTDPTTTIVGPAASSWHGADFVVDVTNADVGSGLNVCYYRVFSNAVQTLAWTTYACGTDPTVTVGAATNCRDEGANMCQVDFYNTDVVGNTGATVSRQYSIDWALPTTAITAPAAATWEGVNFAVSVTNADSGSGLDVCYYRVLSNAVQTLGWTAYGCATNPTITVGAGLDCSDEGANKCQVEVYNTDIAGNTSATDSRQFSIDWTLPTATITAPAAGTWENADFTVSVTNADSGSGLNVCYYRVFSNAAATLAWTAYGCATNPSITVGAAANCRDEGANLCQVEFYDTDIAGNTGNTTTRQFSIDWALPTATITAPAAGTWEGSDFTVSVTNADTGSGLNVCYYRVFSNAVQTLAWTSYGCATNPSITVGAAANCRDEGANLCQVEFYNTDNAGNTGNTTTRQFSIDWALPTATITAPAAGTWEGANFTVSVTNADTGSGLNVCYYRVLSNAVQTLAWTAYGCATNPTINVGAGLDCIDEGANKCQVEFYDTDIAGNTGATVSRQFSIDWTLPTTAITAPAAGTWENADFTVSVTNADTGSGLNVCYYRVFSNAVQTLAWTSYGCATNPTITVGAGFDCVDEGANKCQVEFYNTDIAGNTGATVSRQFSIDWTLPTSTITAPAAGTWENANFTVSVTNADTGGSGLNVCYYRVLSNAVQTLAWTAYGCATNPTINVGAGLDCVDEGANMCQVEFYDTDIAGNTGATVSRQFSIDWTLPTSTITAPAAGTWESANFTVSVTNADTGGSGLNVCYYRVLSNAVQTLAWTAYGCATNPTINVGAGLDCVDEGANLCQVEFYNTDIAGNTGATASRQFSIDWSLPTATITAPAAGTWENADFAVSVTNADVGSGLNVCYYRVFSNAVQTLAWTAYGCATNPTLTVGAAANCRDEGANMCQVELYNTDIAGNTGATVSRQFSIDRTAPTATITAPAAGTWENANFTVSVTNADTGGSGLNVCYYRVYSNAVQTLAWTSYGCATNPTINVGAGLDCVDEGANMCQVEFYDTDIAGNTGATVSRQFSIDWSLPTATITAPAAGTWEGSNFSVSVTNADAGSGLNVCYYRVFSNAVQTLAWTSYGCATNPTINVGVGLDCVDEGANMCQIEFYNTDIAGNTGTTVSRQFSIDWQAPTVTITAPAAGTWEGADFAVSVTNADAGSGLNVCYYRVFSNAVQTLAWTSYGCATNPTITVGAAADCLDEGANMCQVEFYNTDIAGNTSATVSRLFSIDWQAPTTTINNPPAGTWETANFAVNVTNFDAGSGFGTCRYRVLSNGAQTLAWTGYGCATNPTITVGLLNDCRDEGANMCQVEFYAVDLVGNTGATATRQYSIDRTAPTATITAPAAGTWEKANFTVSVTNADTGGSGLDLCYYRVLSNTIQTLGWTSYGCATNPTINVGAGLDCRDEGANMCQVEFYNTDAATNTGATVTRQFSIDWTAPTAAITAPAAGTWENADFAVSVTNADTGGSGLNVCYYRVLSNAVQTLAWTSYGCATNPTLTVGAGMDCRDQGANACQVELYNTDVATNTGATVSRQFSIDWTAPSVTINTPAAGTWESSAFTVNVTNSDADSGLNLCYYRVLSNAVQTLAWTSYGCATNPSISVGAVANCRDQGANMCQVEFYNTDVATNTSATASRQFSIDWQGPTATITAPAAGTWENAAFTVSVTNADVGSGLNVCYYRVLSNAVQTKVWTAYGCATNPSITVGAGANCRDEGANICQVEFYDNDLAGNTGGTTSRQFSIDWTLPTTAITAPAAGTWEKADFAVSVTNFDALSGLDVCYYRVLSNAVETLAWTAYGCATNPTITVGAAADCRDDGANMCRVEFYAADVATNIGATVSRLFSIDMTAPTTTITAPAAGTWESAAFTVSVTNADTGGSGLNVCYYRVFSNAVQTLAWTAYGCATNPSITVGAAANCSDEGANLCQVEFYNTDVVGNTGA
ncbi:MAG: DUF2341 domain-containing protein, partial [bacterium]